MSFDDALHALDAAIENGQPGEVDFRARIFADAAYEHPGLELEAEERRPQLDALLKKLRDGCFFEATTEIVEALAGADAASPFALKIRMQILIEQGKLTEAIEQGKKLDALLQKLPADDCDREAELPEVEGLLGRCYKQLYIDARPTRTEPRTHDYESAVKWYKRRYDATRAYWHGINLVALHAHHASVSEEPDALRKLSIEYAEAVLADVKREVAAARASKSEKSAEALPWLYATQFEAKLALDREDVSRLRRQLKLLLTDPGTTHFVLQSLRRQLMQLWGLGVGSELGREVLGALTARLGWLGEDLDAEDAKLFAKVPEAVFGNTYWNEAQWVRGMFQQARTVAKISRLGAARGRGTGFLIPAALLGIDDGDDWLLLTASHVVAGNSEVRDSWTAPKGSRVDPLLPREASVQFTFPESSAPVKLEGDALFSCAKLDVSLFRIRLPDGVEVRPWGKLGATPRVGKRVNVVGHAEGGGLCFSFRDNEVQGIEEHSLLYRTPTTGGFSGGPVFDESWNVVAVHTGTSAQVHESNAGTLIRVIAEKLNEKSE